MKQSRGRTGRRRRRKHLKSFMDGVNCSHKLEYINLKKWLKERGFEDNHLRPAEFWETGRGLMATKALQAGELIISLPEKCLLTTGTVLSSSLGQHIQKWKPPVSPVLALCTFLIAERHSGHRSPWKPYLDVLPQSYSCLGCLEPAVTALLPRALQEQAQQQRHLLQELFTSSRAFFSSLQPLFAESTAAIFTARALQWAWCTINTRTVYMEQPHRDCFSLQPDVYALAPFLDLLNHSPNVQPLFAESTAAIFTARALQWAWCTINTRTVYMEQPHRDCFSLQPDVYALAPFLDLLNHSPNVQVKAAFNKEKRSYEIWTKSPCKKHQEVFICYGPHDNQRLLLEYGFVAMDNPHSTVHVSADTLLKYFSPLDKQKKAKVSILKDHDFLENLTFGWEGPSWSLLTALRVLSLAAEEFPCWRRILLGEVPSARSEQQALGTAAQICQCLTEETQQVLLQISQLKRDKENLKPQLALVEMLHSENLKILQKSAEILCNLNSGTT